MSEVRNLEEIGETPYQKPPAKTLPRRVVWAFQSVHLFSDLTIIKKI